MVEEEEGREGPGRLNLQTCEVKKGKKIELHEQKINHHVKFLCTAVSLIVYENSNNGSCLCINQWR